MVYQLTRLELPADFVRVIRWLQSPKGEAWSRRRIRAARQANPDGDDSLVDFQEGVAIWPGFFSLRDDYGGWATWSPVEGEQPL